MRQDLKEIQIWNIKYNLLSVEEIVAIVNKWLSEGRRGIHLTGVNAETVAIAQSTELLRDAILDSDIVNVDSYLPAKFLRRKGYNLPDRVPTPDVMEHFFMMANEKRQRVFFLGAKQEVLDLLKDVLKREYPNMVVVGMQNGYYGEKEEPQIASEISDLAPDYLFIALPSPRKEIFIQKYKKLLNVGVFYGIGGALDAKAGVYKRPPKFLQGHGLEGAFRILRKPISHGKRIHWNYKFVKLALKN